MRILVYLTLAVVGLILGAFAAQSMDSRKGHSETSDRAQQHEGESIRFLEDGGFEIEKTKERVGYGFDEVEDLLKADFETLVGRLDPSDDAWVIYLARLVDLDPFRTFNVLLEPQNESLRESGFKVFCEGAVASDPKRALEAVLGVEAGYVLKSLEYPLLYAFAAHHPKTTLAILKDRSKPVGVPICAGIHYGFFSICYQNLAAQDLDSALEACQQIQDPMEANVALRSFVRAKHRSGESYAEIYEWANETFKESQRISALWAVNDDAMIFHPDEVWEFLRNVEDFPHLQSPLSHLEMSVSSLRYSDTETVMALLQEDFIDDWYRHAIRIYLKCAPPKHVMEVYETYLTPELRELSQVKETVLGRVSEMEPDQGFEWLLQNYPKGPLEPEVLQRIADAYAPHVPERLADFVIDRLSPEESGAVLESIMTVWAEKDPEASGEWTQRSLSENPELRNRIAQKQVQIAARWNPSAYAPSLNLVPFTEPHSKLAQTVAHNWSVKDPQAAADWTALIEDHEMAAVAINAVSINWLRYDRMKASEWIRGLPEGEARNAAIKNLLDVIGESDPEVPALWQKELDK